MLAFTAGAFLGTPMGQAGQIATGLSFSAAAYLMQPQTSIFASLGFMPYMLLQSKEVFKGSTASEKITPTGFLRALIESSRPNVVSQNMSDDSGHIRDVKIKYQPRGRTGLTTTHDSCDVQVQPAYAEQTISRTLYRALGIMIQDDVVAAYEKEASAQVKQIQGIPQLAQVNPLMMEFWNTIVRHANTLYGDINIDLVTAMATNFGKNQTTGLTTAKTINFPLDSTNNDLTAGMSGILADARLNEINLNNCYIVGGGLIDNYMLQQSAKSAAQNGLNTAQQPMLQYYNDLYTGAIWGANNFGVFERDSVQLVEANRFIGFKAGIKPGGSWFGVLPLPIMDAQGNMQSIDFDVQVKYVDCPSSVVVGDTYPTSVQRGWQIILSKSYDLFTQPSGAYNAADRLTGNNGTLRYNATNV